SGTSGAGDHPPGWPFSQLVEDSHHAGGADQAEQAVTTDAVDSPSFVSNLVDSTYDHTLQSSVQHMDAPSDFTAAPAIGSDFWAEAAHATNGSSSVVSLAQLSAHSDDGPTEVVQHDIGHDVTGLDVPHVAIFDEVATHPVFEVAHTTDFATHIHL